MKLELELTNGTSDIGNFEHKDDSFVMIRKGEKRIRIYHWTHIKGVFRLEKRGRISVNLKIFKRSKE